MIKKQASIIFIVLIISNVLLWTGMLSTDGIIIQRDLNSPIFEQNYKRYYFPLWNDFTSEPNFERLSRLLYASPFLFLVSIGIPPTLIPKIAIVGTYSLLTISIYLFLEAFVKNLAMKAKNYSNLKFRPDKICLLAGSFVFAYNPVSLQFVGGIPLLFSVAMLPLLMYFILTRIKSVYFPLVFATLLLLSLGHPFTFVMNLTISFLFIVLVYYKSMRMRLIWTKFFFILSLFFLLFSWFLFPYVKYPLGYTDLGREGNLRKDIYDSISNNNIYDIFLLERDNVKYVNTVPSEIIPKFLHYFALSTLVILSFYSLFISVSSRDIPRKIIIFIIAGYIIFTLLSLGAKGPLSQPFWALISNVPLGWIFRSPLKFQIYQSFMISVLFAISIIILKEKLRRETVVHLLIIFVLIGISSYGIYDANFNSLNPIKIPGQFFEINKILSEKNDGYKVLYYPIYDEHQTAWSQGHLISDFTAKSSQIPTFDLVSNYNNIGELLYFLPYNNGLLNSPNFYDFLSSLGIRYIVFHNDRNYDIDQTNLSYLFASTKLKSLYNNAGWYLFEIINKETAMPIRAISNLVIVNNRSDIFKIAKPNLGVLETKTLYHNTKVPLPYENLIRLVESNQSVRTSDRNLESGENRTTKDQTNFTKAITHNDRNTVSTLQVSPTKINPTLWRVKINASIPFMLVFPETYHRGWVASSQSPTGNYQTNSIPLYGGINGFYINKTGEFMLDIEFEPQKWFYYGFAVSLISVVGYVTSVTMIFLRRPNSSRLTRLGKTQ